MNINVAIVSMVKSNETANNTLDERYCKVSDHIRVKWEEQQKVAMNNVTAEKANRYPWTQTQQGLNAHSSTDLLSTLTFFEQASC